MVGPGIVLGAIATEVPLWIHNYVLVWLTFLLMPDLLPLNSPLKGTDYSVKQYQLLSFYSQSVYVIVEWNWLTGEIDKTSVVLPQVPPRSKLDHMQQPKVYVWIPRNLFWRTLYSGSYFGMIHLGQLSGSPVLWERKGLVLPLWA